MQMEDMRFFLNRPNGKERKSFSIICYRLLQRDKKEYLPLPDHMRDVLIQVNNSLKTKIVDQGQAELLLKELISEQYRKSKVKDLALKHSDISEINAKVLKVFWADKYEVRYFEDDKTPLYDFIRSFKAIEPLSIQAASQLALQNALRKNLSNTPQIRRATERLNEVLKYLKRSFKMEKPKKPMREIRHLSKVDFLKTLPHFGCVGCRNLAISLFTTGVRIGEAMALRDPDLYGLELNVNKQVSLITKKTKPPKRGKQGKVAVIEFGFEGLKNWISETNKWSHRHHFNGFLIEACRKANVPLISAHDLRHSHAIHLLSLGANLTEVSLNLRNRIEVCQEYYTGYSHSEGTLDRLKKITSEND